LSLLYISADQGQTFAPSCIRTHFQNREEDTVSLPEEKQFATGSVFDYDV
jgi:hypothetical protein